MVFATIPDLKTLEGNIIKNTLGILTRTQTRVLLDAVNMLTIKEIIEINKINLFLRLCSNELTSKLIKEVIKAKKLTMRV